MTFKLPKTKALARKHKTEAAKIRKNKIRYGKRINTRGGTRK